MCFLCLCQWRLFPRIVRLHNAVGGKRTASVKVPERTASTTSGANVTGYFCFEIQPTHACFRRQMFQLRAVLSHPFLPSRASLPLVSHVSQGKREKTISNVMEETRSTHRDPTKKNAGKEAGSASMSSDSSD